MITDEQLAALDEAEKKATAGPCEAVLKDDGCWRIRYPKIPRGFHGDCYHFSLHVDESDAHFIALSRNSMRQLILSRNSMRQLIDEVRAKRAIVDQTLPDVLFNLRMEKDQLRAELSAARDALRKFIDCDLREVEAYDICKRIDDSKLLEDK